VLRIRVVTAVLRAAFRNSILRRVAFAYLLFRAAESGIWIALLVYAYRHGGVTSGMLMMLVQIVPSVVFSPFLGAMADYVPPSRMLKMSYAAQTVAVAGLTAAVELRASVVVVFFLGAVSGLVMTTARPSHAALLPAIVRTPEELTAANVMGGWADGAANLVGPGLAAVFFAVQGAPLALGVMGALTLVSLAALLGVGGPAAAVTFHTDADRTRVSSVGARFRSNVGQIVRTPQLEDLLILHTFYYVVVGALDLLCVVLALNYLHLGSGGPGLLNAAAGGGGLVAGAIIIFVVGRKRLVGTLTISIAVTLAALGLVGAGRSEGLVIVLFVVVGMGGGVFDTAGQTLMQRSAPPDSIAGTFAIREALANLGLALGAVLVRVAIALGGLKISLVAPAVVGLVLAAALGRRLRSIDKAAVVPQVEIQLLRSLALFAALPMPTIEGLAHRLEPVLVPQGSKIIVEGERGDCYYCVADGELSVTRDGHLVQRVKRGDGFGELALLRDVPRQATVTADTDSVLYRLEKIDFLQMISSSPQASRLAESVIEGYGDFGRPGWGANE
jgi:MFS family permease